MAFRYRSPVAIRCSVCGVARTSYYRQPIGETMYNFCSGAHVEAAKRNYQKNKDNPLVPDIAEDPDRDDPPYPTNEE